MKLILILACLVFVASVSFTPHANTGFFWDGNRWCLAWRGQAICLGAPAQAADQITVDITGTPVAVSVSAPNKALITRLMTKENARRAAEDPPLAALTLNEFTRDLLVDMFRGYKVQVAGEAHQDACARFRALTPAQQLTELARAAWGGDAPCP